MLATIQSGGTGINLDDTVGNRPRSVHIMTPPLTANDMAQAIGRVHRKNTKSASNIHAILSDTAIDQWNAGILHDKFRTLGAVSGGQITRGADVLGPSDVPEFPDETPYDWGQSLLDTRNYADTPAYHNELIKDFGGERVKRGDNWTTAFPSPQHYSNIGMKLQNEMRLIVPRGSRKHRQQHPARQLITVGVAIRLRN